MGSRSPKAIDFRSSVLKSTMDTFERGNMETRYCVLA